MSSLAPPNPTDPEPSGASQDMVLKGGSEHSGDMTLGGGAEASSVPAGTSSQHPERKNEVWDKLDDLLSGPRLARLISGGLIVLVALAVCVTQLSDLWERIKISRHSANEYSSMAGVHVPGKDDPNGAAQAGKQTLQVEHLNHHIALHDGKTVPLPIEIAPLVPSGVTIGIEYFTSDGCIFVHRHRGETEADDWLSDPTIYPEKNKTPAVSKPVSAPVESGGAVLRLVSDRTEAAPYSAAQLLRVQRMGRCLGSHPPPFNWWWGPPSGCWVPMIRQFPDGCRHHQMFNSCANYWDSTITWDWCVH
jgi:hypothetical protein